MRFLDALYGLPTCRSRSLPSRSSATGPKVWALVIALSIAAGFTAARIVRGQIITLKENDYVRAARARARSYRARPRTCSRTHSACSSLRIVLEVPGAIFGEASCRSWVSGSAARHHQPGLGGTASATSPTGGTRLDRVPGGGDLELMI